MERQAVSAWAVTAERSDDALVSAAQAGDRVAFGLLYDRYARMVHGILLCRVPPREVDDLVQDVFVSALRQLRALRDISRFGAWLGAITRNRANDYYRRSIPEEQVAEAGAEEESEARASDPVVEQEARAILAMLQTLPDAYREPLTLRLVEGMTGPEISARTGMTHGSVRVNLCRGMQLLREKLSQKAGGTGKQRKEVDQNE